MSLQCTANFICIFNLYYLCSTVNEKANMFARPLRLRIAFYTLASAFMFGVWLFTRDILTVHRDQVADEEASAVSEEYAKGALEYYNKILQRNIALRSLLGEEEGPKQFTALGNAKESFRTTHQPIVARRDRAEAYLKSLEEEKAKEREESKRSTALEEEKAMEDSKPATA